MVSTWAEEFHRKDPNRQIAFLYLANHILQESRKKGREYMDEFFKALPRVLVAAARSPDEKLRTSGKRLLDIWDERKIFGTAHIKSMKEAVAKAGPPPPSSSSAGGSREHASGSGAGGPATDELKRKLAAVGSLGEVMFDVSNAVTASGTLANKCLQLKAVRAQAMMPPMQAAWLFVLGVSWWWWWWRVLVATRLARGRTPHACMHGWMDVAPASSLAGRRGGGAPVLLLPASLHRSRRLAQSVPRAPAGMNHGSSSRASMGPAA